MTLRTCLPIILLSIVTVSFGRGERVRAQPPAPAGSGAAVPEAPPAVEQLPVSDPFIEWDNPAIDNVFNSFPAEGYYAYDHTVGSIVALPDFYFPGTVNVVTREMIRDQQALSFSDILRDIGGAVQSNAGLGAVSGEGIHFDQFLLRGLDVSQFNFRKNGFLDPTYTPRDFANIERVEVLKGPASVLYGAGQPAGTVNLITKKALAERFSWGGITLGSDSLQRYQFDVNSMNEAGDLLVRVNGVYQDGQGFRNFGYNERSFIAPVITKLLGDDTAFTWEGEFHQDRRLRDSGIIAVNGDPNAFSQALFFGAPTDFAEFNDYRSTLSFTHRFNDEWQLYIGQTSLFYDAESRGTVPQTGFTTALTPQGFYAASGGFGNLLNRTQNYASPHEQNHAVIANLSGVAEDPWFQHNLLLGTEVNWYLANNNRFTNSIPGLDPALTFDPTTGAQPFPGATPVSASFAFNSPGYYQERFGVYLQDVVALTEQLNVMANVRFDTLRVQYDRQLLFGGFPIFAPPQSNETFDHVTPRVGATYEVLPGAVTLYGLYTQSFAPPNRSNFAQAPLEAETGEMFEAGIKTNLYDDLILTVSAFVIERDNVAVQVNNFSVVDTAEQTSKGVEFNLIGQVTERLSTVANYTYADVEQAGFGAMSPLNGRVRGVPFGSGNMWARYNVIQEQDTTLGLGLGYVYVGERRGDYATPLRLPSYSRWDIGVFGQYGRWDLNAYVENIFDVRYETGATNQYQVYPGAPANFRLQIGANF